MQQIHGKPCCSQCVSSNRQADGAGHALSVGLAQSEAQAVLVDLGQGGQRLGDVLGGGVEKRAQVFGRHRLHLAGDARLGLRRQTRRVRLDVSKSDPRRDPLLPPGGNVLNCSLENEVSIRQKK